MSTDDLTTSVFTDDSGSRKRVVTWTITGASCLLGIGALAIAVSVFGQVSLPGLDAPIHIPGVGPSRPRTPGAAASGSARAPDRSGTADVGTTSATTSGKTSASTPTTTVPTAKTPAATTTPKVKPSAKPTPAANPVHSPGSGPTVPPGRPKKTTSGK